MPNGGFSLVHGVAPDVGRVLVRHPLIEAVAFTGSLRAGRSLFDTACARDRPIPVYAEMGSVNPVFLLPGALQSRGEAIAQAYVQSVTLGAGQFCTNPGLVFAIAGPELEAFLAAAARVAERIEPAVMLHSALKHAFDTGVGRMARIDGVRIAVHSADATLPARPSTARGCTLFATDGATFQAHSELAEEVFGPSSIVVACRDRAELEGLARGLAGQLTATVHAADSELLEHRSLIRILERKVGRLIMNGFPTGIEVCSAMHHGGPYPATTDVHYTSIGTASILRFLRPICYQGFPESELPEPLRDANPRALQRLVDGEPGR
jgi:NADP-dependent aldehyde dehydrogenase